MNLRLMVVEIAKMMRISGSELRMYEKLSANVLMKQ